MGDNNTFNIANFDEQVNDSKKNKATKYKRIGLRMNFQDYEDLVRYVNYKIIKEKQHSYIIRDAISEALKLLFLKYDFARNMEPTKFKVGRKDQTTQLETKETTVDLSEEDLQLVNDFIYFKKYNEEKTDFSRIQFSSELISVLKKHHAEAFK